MTDLLSRVRTAIDETERIAQAAKRRAPRPWMGTFKQVVEGPIGDMTIVASTDWAEVSHHIDANDPDRVLRRCAADRKLLDMWQLSPERELQARIGDWTSCSDSCPPAIGEYVLKTLAEAYGVEV